MDLETILTELRSQRARIDEAIAALQGTAPIGLRVNAGGNKRRHMSAAARARIGAAKKAWWAKQKRSSRGSKKPIPISTANRKPMSSGARKKLPAQARWAARKKAA